MLVLLLIFVALASAQPRFVAYLDKINRWWPPTAIAGDLGVPGYSHPYKYNVINIAFWTSGQGPVDAGLLWSKALYYCSSQNPWGNTTEDIQKAWLKAYHDQGVKVLISAFGSTDFPTSQGADPVKVAIDLAAFVKTNNLDGVDLDWEDNSAMDAGKGEAWLISCTTKLRQLLPRPFIISHAPQAPYFMGRPHYPGGGYLTVDAAVGSMIDYYNIQFYNQGTSTYETYQTLFEESNGWASGTAVAQLAAKIPKSRLVVGKGVTPGDVVNTGYVPVGPLKTYLSRGVGAGYTAGFMGWQFSSDATGSWSTELASVF